MSTEINQQLQKRASTFSIHLNFVFACCITEWGFNRIDKKVNGRYRSMTFSSELFCRDKPHLCHRMKLKSQKKTASTKHISHLFDARKIDFHTTPHRSATAPSFLCKKSPRVPSCQYPFWQNSLLSTEPIPINNNNTDSTSINAASNLQSETLFLNDPRHSRYSIQQDAAMNLHCIETLTWFAVQNQQDASSYQCSSHFQVIDLMSHPNINIGMKSADNNVTNIPAMSNRHQVIDGGNVFPPQVATTSVAKKSIRPEYCRINSEPILPRTAKGASELQVFSLHHYDTNHSVNPKSKYQTRSLCINV